MAAFNQAIVFGDFNPDNPSEQPITQSQLMRFMTSYYTMTSNLNSVITEVVMQQQQAFADSAAKAQENRTAIEKIFDQVTALKVDLDTSVGQHKTSLETTLSQALTDLTANCAENDKKSLELETHLKTWAEDHEELIKKDLHEKEMVIIGVILKDWPKDVPTVPQPRHHTATDTMKVSLSNLQKSVDTGFTNLQNEFSRLKGSNFDERAASPPTSSRAPVMLWVPTQLVEELLGAVTSRAVNSPEGGG